MSDPINFCKNEGNCRGATCPDATSGIAMIAEEDLFYMFKTEPPHIPVYTNKFSPPTVKDICIDQGVQCFEKVLVEFDKVDKSIHSSSNLAEVTVNGSSEDLNPSSTNEGLGSFEKNSEKNVGDRECSSPFKHATALNAINEPVIDDDLRSLIVSGCLAEHCYSGNAICEGEKIDTAEISAGKIPSEKMIEQESNLLPGFNSDFLQVDSSTINGSFAEDQDLRQNLDQVTLRDERLTTMASPMQTKECRQVEATVRRSENASSFPVTSADTNSNRIDNRNGASDDVKFHDGALTSDLEPKGISIVGNEREVIGGGTTARSLFSLLIHESASLPGAAAAMSGPIPTSGHIPYSGSISHRSDSSTTSTHSFAFPILQSEWNSSPVRMAKADQKRSRKHRWRTALICCKF